MNSLEQDTPSVVVERSKRVHVKNKSRESHDEARHSRLQRKSRIEVCDDETDWRDFIDR